jgi:hypothetical protein
MSDVQVEQPVPFSDLADIETTGLMPTTAFVDALGTQPIVTTAADFASQLNAVYAQAAEVLTPDQLGLYEQAVNPLGDAVNDGIVPPAQARDFFYWLNGNQQVFDIPSTGTYAFVQGFVVKWAQQNGWATYGPNPLPTPLAQSFIESANAAQPLPGAVNVPAVLPSPSQGQSTVGAAAREITPSTIPATGLSPTAAAQVQAAIGVASADVLKAQAAVVDAMLPNLSPGQATEALEQLNRAVNALEVQLGQVRNGQWPRGYQGTLQALNGALEALHGLSQEVNILAEQMATKADSGLEDGIAAVAATAAATAAGLATVTGTTIPALEGQLGDLTGTVDRLGDTVNDDVVPELSQLAPQVAANTAKLNLTDDECLEQLCDTVNNVASPIKEGGATPSLLKTLGALLAGGLALTTIIGMMDTILAVLNIKTAVAGVVQDTETLTNWAEQAAGVIEQQFSLAGWG